METPVMIEAKTSIFKQRNKSPFRITLGESLVCKQTLALLIEEKMVLYHFVKSLTVLFIKVRAYCIRER